MTTTVAINQGPDTEPVDEGHPRPHVEPVGLTKDVLTKFPIGFIGDPTPIQACSVGQFLKAQSGLGENPEDNECPEQSAVGVASVTIWEPVFLSYATFTVPLFDLETYFGEPARFGFYLPAGHVPVVLDASLRSGPGEGAVPGQSEDYGIDVNSTNISQTAGLLSARVTVWGTPGDPRHDNSRGWSCLFETRATIHGPCGHPKSRQAPAFLTMPTSCAQPMQASVAVDQWARPGVFADYLPTEPLPTLEACNQLPFSPTIEASPTTDRASAPSGLDVNLDFQDDGLTSEEGLAQSNLKDTVVSLPEGFTVNPSSGVGLAGCTNEDFARETLTSAPGAGCPDNAKLGTVEVTTPLLPNALHGSLYISQPYENRFDSLLALYIIVRDEKAGVLIKLAGKVTPNPLTGQLVTTFQNNPQLAFSHFNFHFREGNQAPLITPPACGTYTTQADLTSWADPASVLTDSSSFTIAHGFDGGACPSGGIAPFQPQIQAGLSNNNAGAFSSFYLHLTRNDADQEITGFSTSLPPGLSGILTGIPFCPEADIALARTKTGAQEQAGGSCPASSELGHSLVGTGAGAVLAYTPGRVYLAGPYNGAPFSLVSVTSAVVGPFDLGTVVIRFALRIDPHTAQINVDPTASEPIPHIIQGIVTHVRDIRVFIDRPNFTFNPTSCEPTGISSTLTGNDGASATVTSRFQAASCANLKFTPKLTVSTAAKATKANGASLNFKIIYPKGAIGTQSWFNEAKFDLPKQLPARLTTIQKACLAATFEADRAACPSASKIGHAIVHTPVLPVPLEGAVYFVSYGSAKFPDAVVVLDGYGVHIELHGETFINSKTGVTSATFRNTPDVPFESIEVDVPSGPFSEFGSNLPASAHGSFCGQGLTMPSFFKAQNGLEIRQSTRIAVTGCPKAKTRAQKLKAALKACHKKTKGKRASCERVARKKYGPIKSNAKKNG